jgi:pimeloyl-ACP methyl ester carboxylesterase
MTTTTTATSRALADDATEVHLHVETFGSPDHPTLLFVNGLGSQCINFRSEWMEMFAAEGFHVVRFDNRDVGLSSSVDLPYTLSDMASDAIAVLDALDVERAHVVGVSLGGMIVQTLAIEHPQRLLSVTSVMSTTGEAEYGQSAPEAQALLLSTPPADRDAAIQRHIDGLRIWGSEVIDEDLQRAYAAEAFDRSLNPAGVGRQLQAAMRSGSRADALRDVTVPFLVLHGTRDTLIGPSGGRRTAELVPGARLELIEGMGHDYPVEIWPRWVELITTHARSTP